ncbi:MarR family winged helix-turn-helix transcriptional regulator [Mucilaginibacter sp.]|uniref:MarR family winged helix-turn-helix transcriptional regulator n=1 Tax=Mucilaginibacter sp. TaxID=1882438 RepID=UPI002608ED4A|nr:MarR family winged helix-turn-helix transcriptional regulator [Mucilaginibacter sp.]MDB5031194.1 transcriptional regulator, MarR family [Mucilaginibacter sp.]
MKEDQVKTKFSSLSHEVLFKIKLTNDWLAFWQSEFLNNFNISPEQYDVLYGIQERCSQIIRLRDIKCCTAHRISDISRLTDRLEAKQLIQKTADPNDRRNTYVTITTEGTSLLHCIAPKMEAWLKTFSGLNVIELQHLNTLLDKINNQT